MKEISRHPLPNGSVILVYEVAPEIVSRNKARNCFPSMPFMACLRDDSPLDFVRPSSQANTAQEAHDLIVRLISEDA